MAAAGIASRRACEEIIFQGRVRVNGSVTLLPQTMVDDNDRIEVDKKPLSGEESKVYYLLNKPLGYLCSSTRKGRQKLVLDLFGKIKRRLFTVGRLDKETTGLLIVTNDGEFANRVIHPSSNIQKEYIAKTGHEITPELLRTISKGAFVEEVFIKPMKVTKVRRGTLKVTVNEGKKREVRRLIEAAGLEVRELKRVRIGNLRMGDLPIGSWRKLTEKEKEQIFA